MAKIQTHPQQWAIISKAWSLARSRRADLSRVELRKYFSEELEADAELDDVLFDFGARLLQAKGPLYMGAYSVMNECAKRAPERVNDFRAWYATNLAREHKDRYFDIFSQFFRDYGEFGQALLLTQYNLPIGRDESASSQALPRNNIFYAKRFRGALVSADR